MKNKSKKINLWEQVNRHVEQCLSRNRELVVRRMVDSKEQVESLLIGCINKNSVIGRW